MVHHGAAASIRTHTEPFRDYFGHVAVAGRYDDVRHVMSEWVAIAERERRLRDRLDSAELRTAEVPQIVDDVGSEELVQAIECALVHDMAVEGDELMDGQPVAERQRHWNVRDC